MHEEKIWAMDFIEMLPLQDVEDDEEAHEGHKRRETLRMITGAGDSSVKLWTDSTLEE